MKTIEEKQDRIHASPLGKLLRDFAGYIPAFVIPAGLNFGSLILFTKLFLPEEYGRYSLLISLATFITIILSQWSIQAAQKFRPEYERNGLLKQFNQNMGFIVVFNTFLLAAASGVIYYVLTLNGNFGVQDWLLVIVLIWTQIVYTTGLSILQSDSRVTLYRAYQMTNAVLKFIIAVIWVYLVEREVNGLLYGWIAANGLLIVPLLVQTGLMKAGSHSLRMFFPFLRKFMRFGIPVVGWFICVSILDVCDRYILEWFRSSSEVGVYTANYSLAAAVIGVTAAPLFSAAHPMIMKAATASEVEQLMTRFTQAYLLLAVPIGGYLLLFHEEVCRFLLGEQYAEGSMVLPVLVIGFLIWYLSIIGHKGYEYTGRTKTMLAFVAVSAGLNLAGNFMLIPSYGYMGAAYATLIGFSAYTLLTYLFSYRCIPWRISGRFGIKLAMVAIATYILLTVLKESGLASLTDFWTIALGGVIQCLVYAALLLGTKVFHLEQLKQIMAAGRK